MKPLKTRSRPTKHVADKRDSMRFIGIFWLRLCSAKLALSRPAHQRVTHTVDSTQSELSFSFLWVEFYSPDLLHNPGCFLAAGFPGSPGSPPGCKQIDPPVTECIKRRQGNRISTFR